jgi:integrase
MRFAGLRCPSETHGITWRDVNWDRRLLTVYAPKTHKTRIVPIIPTLLPLLQAAYDAAPEGAETVITLSRNNLHRAFHEVIRNAGLLAWPDLFQTLRRSCETDFARTCPQHAVSTWIGHSMRVSEKHYLQMTDDLYDLATGRAAESAAAGHGTDSHDAAEANRDHARRNKKTSQTPLIATECEALLSEAEGTRTPNHRIDSPVL